MCIRCVSSSRKKGRISSLLCLKVTAGDFAFRNLVGAHPLRTWKYVTNHKYCRAKHFTTDSRDQIGGSFWNRCVFSTQVKGDNHICHRGSHLFQVYQFCIEVPLYLLDQLK